MHAFSRWQIHPLRKEGSQQGGGGTGRETRGDVASQHSTAETRKMLLLLLNNYDSKNTILDTDTDTAEQEEQEKRRGNDAALFLSSPSSFLPFSSG